MAGWVMLLILAIGITVFGVVLYFKKRNWAGVASFVLGLIGVIATLVPLIREARTTPDFSPPMTTHPATGDYLYFEPPSENDLLTTTTAPVTTTAAPTTTTANMAGRRIPTNHTEAVYTVSGSLTNDGQTNRYIFTPPRAGQYRFEISGMYANRQISLSVLDSGGDQIAVRNWAGNDDGITTSDLETERQYIIQVRQARGHTPYVLNIGFQQETVAVNDRRVFDGELSFTNQINRYSFTPSRAGTYRFEISNLFANRYVHLSVVDRGGDAVSWRNWVGNDAGITVNNLNPGESYTILVRQARGISRYRLNIGYQAEIRSISEGSSRSRYIEFTDQVNKYSFSPSRAGAFRFEISGLQANRYVHLSINDEGGDSVVSRNWVGNGGAITTDNLNLGEIYTIRIRQARGFTPYTLRVD